MSFREHSNGIDVPGSGRDAFQLKQRNPHGRRAVGIDSIRLGRNRVADKRADNSAVDVGYDTVAVRETPGFAGRALAADFPGVLAGLGDLLPVIIGQAFAGNVDQFRQLGAVVLASGAYRHRFSGVSGDSDF
jgi:hypothetical protein